MVHDLDVDGKKDLIVGSANGFVVFYKNVGTNAAPLFNSYDTLKTRSGSPIQVLNGASRPHFVDWKGDGDLDLIVGGYEGNVEYFENTQTGICEETEQRHAIGLAISPNPAVHQAVFCYSLPRPILTQVNVYSALGRRVSTLINQRQAEGPQRFIWNLSDDSGRKLPAGVYFIEFKIGIETTTTTILIVR